MTFSANFNASEQGGQNTYLFLVLIPLFEYELMIIAVVHLKFRF